MGRRYTVVFEAVAITAVQDLFQIVNGTNRSVKPIALFLHQTTDLQDAAEEVLRLRLRSGQTTDGSGGTAPTPQPNDPSDAAAGFTAEVNNTTQASAGTILTHWVHGWNIRMPFEHYFTEKTQKKFDGARRWTLELVAAPIDSITASGTLELEEE